MSPLRPFVVFVFCFFISPIFGQVPIPTKPDGFAIGSPAAPVVIDGFFDLLCPDSAASWPIIKQIIKLYGGDINWIMHTFPLPFHTNAFIANQGLHVISAMAPSQIWPYTDLLFNNQANYWNAATANITINDVIENMAELVEGANILDRDDFISGIANVSINWETRVSWKYGCSRYVSGTPTFLVNGVFVSADASWTVDDWRSTIDPILQANGIAPPKQTKPARRPHFKYQVSPLTAPATNTTCPPNQTLCNYAPNKFECCLAGENCIPNVGCRC